MLSYLWYEEIPLIGSEYGEFAGKNLAMPCGGTLVFDDLNNLLFWANKPGTEFAGEHAVIGAQRKQALLQHFSHQLLNGAV